MTDFKLDVPILKPAQDCEILMKIFSKAKKNQKNLETKEKKTSERTEIHYFDKRSVVFQTFVRYIFQVCSSSDFCLIMFELKNCVKLLMNDMGGHIYGNVTSDSDPGAMITSRNNRLVTIISDRFVSLSVAIVIYKEDNLVKKVTINNNGTFILTVSCSNNYSLNHDTFGFCFAIYRRPETAWPSLLLRDLLIPGIKAIAAGYAIIGPSPRIVSAFSHIDSVTEFAYDLKSQSFVDVGTLSIPDNSNIISFNEGDTIHYDENLSQWLNNKQNGEGYTPRFTGLLPLDVHTIVHSGGVYISPSDNKERNGRMQFVFECIPVAILMTKMGGLASDSTQEPILKRTPKSFHDSTSFFFGTPGLVEDVLKSVSRDLVST